MNRFTQLLRISSDFQSIKPFSSESKSDETIAADDIADLSLNLLKSGVSTRLAFQMIENSSEAFKVLTTIPIGTMIESLLI
jgi:hypothetical protein